MNQKITQSRENPPILLPFVWDENTTAKELWARVKLMLDYVEARRDFSEEEWKELKIIRARLRELRKM
jgi:hypothetical protein